MTVDLDKEDEQQMQFFVVTMAIQSFKKKNKPLFTCFVDFAKAFDSVKHQAPVTLGKTCFHGCELKNDEHTTINVCKRDL